MHTYPTKYVHIFCRKYVQETVSELNIFTSTVVPFESLPNKYLGTTNSTMAQETAFMTAVNCIFGEIRLEVEERVEHKV